MANIDANLLIIFKILWEERSSTKAAGRLHITQSAVSQALKKLRLAFRDDLFVRVPKGLAPTPLAIELSRSVLDAVDSIEGVFQFDRKFDPKLSTSTFNLAATDYFERLIIPDLTNLLLNEANKSRVRFSLLSGALPKAEMQNGVIDCAVAGYFKDVPDGFFQKSLFKDTFVGLCDHKHPFLKSNRSITEYCKHPHVMASISGDFKGVVDSALPKDAKRHVFMTSTSFLSLPHSLQGSTALFVLPKRLAELHCRDFALEVFEPPIKTPTIHIKMIWHERTHRDPFQKWMRDKLSEFCR